MTTTDRGAAPLGAAPAADLTQLASGNRRVARELVAAERDRIAAAQQVALDDAAADRQLRVAEGRLRLAEQRAAVDARQRKARQAQREADRAARRARRQARRKARQAWRAERIAHVRGNAVSVYSSLIYGLSVGGAVYGQISAALGRGWTWPAAVVASAAVEGLALTMALTANEQRKQGERALAARTLTWVCAIGAGSVNYLGHVGQDRAGAVLLAALSLAGIVVWEIRSGVRHRPTLRRLGQLPDPAERFGWRRWVAAPAETWAAWRLDARGRVSPGAAALIAHVQAAAHARAERTAAERADADQRAARAEVVRLARQAATRAARKGQAGPALAALTYLAHTGTPAPAPALPAAATPVDPDVRELCEMVRRQAAGTRGRLFGSVPPRPGEPAPRATHGVTATHGVSTQRAALVLARESAQGRADGPDEPAREPEQPPADEPDREPRRRMASEPGDPAPGEPMREPQRRGHEPGAMRRRTAAIAAGARRLTVSARADSGDADALAAAYGELCESLGREPSGAELAARTGVSKATANRWKAGRTGARTDLDQTAN